MYYQVMQKNLASGISFPIAQFLVLFDAERFLASLPDHESYTYYVEEI